MSDSAKEAIRIRIEIDRDPVPSIPAQISGRLRITVGGSPLMIYRGDQLDSHDGWRPIHGELLGVNLLNIYDSLLAIQDGSVGPYETEQARLETTSQYLVFERLSENHLRVVFRVYPPETDTQPTFAHPASECGYPVLLDELCREAAECGQMFIAAAEEFDHRLDQSPIPEIQEAVKQLSTTRDA